VTDRGLTILVLSSFDGTDANVTRDFLFSFNAYSRHRYYYVFDCRTLDHRVDLAVFDAILLFWGVDLLGPDISAEVQERIAQASATKILFLQDEHRDVRATNEVMRRLGANLVFTCVDEADHDTFYPRHLIPSLRTIHTVLPGYVPAYLERLRPGGVGDRPLDVTYRSRVMPFYLGDLGQEKRIIAERFQTIAREHGLASDISVREEDRLYGRRWVQFLRSSRCVLGSSSGASVIDFTGDIRQNCERYIGVNPAATYADVKARFFADADWKVVIDTVSPRVFEAAALRCTMVHHEGRYGGLLEPDRHYIRMRRDYSNVTDVVDRLRDRRFCQEVAEHAHRDLVASERFSYRAFARMFDRCLDLTAWPRVGRAVSLGAFYRHAYVRHGQAIIPYRNRFLILPSTALVFELARRVLGKLPHAQPGPVLSRLIRNPGNALVKSGATVAAVIGTPALRALARECLRVHPMRFRQSVFSILDDLRKLDIVRRLRGGTLVVRQPFHLAIEFDPASRVLRLISRPAGPARPTPAAVPRDVAAAVAAGEVALMLWDHSSLGHQITYATRRGKWSTVGLGPGGVHRFDVITEVYRRAPEMAGRHLLSLLNGDGNAP